VNNVPVALITYNRPEHTKKVLNALEKLQISKLYIFSDAPKTDKNYAAVEETRKIISGIKWIDAEIIIQKENQGLAKSIVKATDIVFEKYNQIILLEDDCIPREYFMEFMIKCLDKYRGNEKIFGISGYTVPIPDNILKEYNYDLYFSPRIGSWGWATWKEKWKKRITDLPALAGMILEKKIDITLGGNDVPVMLTNLLNGSLKDVWTMQWLLNVYLNEGLYIYPTKSHIDNIGMDGTGVHCGKTEKFNTIFADKSPKRLPDIPEISQNILKVFQSFYDIFPREDRKQSLSKQNFKVVQICTQDNGGAGIAAYRLNKGLNQIGINSKMIVLNKTKNDPEVKAIPDDFEKTHSLVEDGLYHSTKMDRKWREWFLYMNSYSGRPVGNEIFTTLDSEVDLTAVDEILSANIINLHWVAGMLDYSKIKNLLKNKTVVWTLHDMNAFTGGCHYTSGCDKFIDKCGACPQLGSKDQNDISRQIWQKKADLYSGLNIKIVTPSNWLKDEAKKSSLFSRFSVSVIPYGFPLNTYFPYPKKLVRQNLGIPEDAKVILFGAISGTKRKGFEYLVKALNIINTEKNNEKIILGIFGNFFPDNKNIGNFDTKYFGMIEDEEVLAMLYSMADVFIIPSLEDNLPNVVIEAMACGIPVAGFDIGGIPDMITHKVDGYIAREINPESLAEGIRWCLNADANLIKETVIKKVQEKFGLNKQAENYKKLYLNLLQGKSQSVNKKVNLIKTNDPLKISIVTPNYNQDKYLEETIDSILSQNYPNLEYVIIDGGSTDDSVKIIKKYEKYLKYWLSEKDEGQYNAINKGFAVTSGEIMAWLNSDDKYHPGSFEKIAEAFKENPHAEWITGLPSSTNEDKGDLHTVNFIPVYSREKMLSGLYWSPFIQQEGTFWRRSLWERSGSSVSEKYKLAGDLELWIRFFRYAQLYTINSLIGCFRVRKGQRSLDQLSEYLTEAEDIIKAEQEKYKIGKFEKIDNPERLVIKYDNANELKVELINYSNLCFLNSTCFKQNNFEIPLKLTERIRNFFSKDINKQNLPEIAVFIIAGGNAELFEKTMISIISQIYIKIKINVIGDINEKYNPIFTKYDNFITTYKSATQNEITENILKNLKNHKSELCYLIKEDFYVEPGLFYFIANQYNSNRLSYAFIGAALSISRKSKKNEDIFDKNDNSIFALAESLIFPQILLNSLLLQQNGIFNEDKYFLTRNFWNWVFKGESIRKFDRIFANKFEKELVNIITDLNENTEISLNGANYSSIENQVEKYIENRDYEKAGGLLADFLKNNPDNENALNNLAVLFSIKGDNSNAIKTLEKILKKNPRNKIAAENLSMLISQKSSG